MDGRAPMSRVELAPSYLASHEVPASCGTILGATAPTAGSAKCGSSRSSQPGPGTQSESRNATSSVEVAASPVFLAAPGPPLTDRRIIRAPYRSAMPAIAAGSAEASSTTMTTTEADSPAPWAEPGARRAGGSDPQAPRADPGPQSARGSARRPARQRASSACRSRTGITTVTADRSGVTLTAPESAGSVRDDACVVKSGWARPASSSRRASTRDASWPGTGVPENQPLTWRAPAGVSRSTRIGEPPTSTRPPATNRVPGSGVSRRPAGAGAATGTARGSAVSANPAAAPGTWTRNYWAAKPARGLSSQSWDGGRRGVIVTGTGVRDDDGRDDDGRDDDGEVRCEW